MSAKFLTGIDLNNQRALAMASPSAGSDGANKAYVDNLSAGLAWKAPVRVATTTSGALATAYASGQTVDGIVLATGDRILLKDQAAQAGNGIYTVNAVGAPTRATDADTTAELENATAFVSLGTVNADRAYTQTATVTTVGTTAQVWVQFGGGSAYTADGIGIDLVGTQFQLVLDGTSLSKSASGLRIGSAAAGAGLVEAAGILAVGQGTGILVTADTVSIDTAVVVRKFAISVGDGAATSYVVTHGLGTRDVNVSVAETASPFTQVFADVTMTTINTVTVAFATAPAASFYRVTVLG